MSLFKKLLKKKEVELYSPITGTLLPISELNDGVFSEKMMGDGFYIDQNNQNKAIIYSPIEGEIESVFPTKHAISFQNSRCSLLLHLGIDTVELNGIPFNLFVQQGDTVIKGQKIAEVDMLAIKAAGKSAAVIVVFPELKENKFVLRKTGDVIENEVIGLIK